MTPLATHAASMTAPRATFADYSELTKPRLSMMSVVSSLAGYVAARHGFSWVEFFHVFAGTALCAGGVASLNQWMEHETDALMSRTHDRPIPSGKVPTGSAFVLGWLLSIAGMVELYVAVNGWAALYALATVIAYLGLYTPSKKRTRWSTEIGAVSGALPPLIGWAAAEGGVSTLGWVLFGILFFWQIPHFIAIALFRQEDYDRAGLKTLPSERGPEVAKLQAVVYTGLLVVSSLLLYVFRVAGVLYLVSALLLGLLFFAAAIANLRPGTAPARKLFVVSLLYLTLLFVALGVDTALRA